METAKGDGPRFFPSAASEIHWRVLRLCCIFASQLGLHQESPRIGFNFIRGEVSGEVLGEGREGWEQRAGGGGGRRAAGRTMLCLLGREPRY